jgi:GNAT superfamily N-acetyltransferase
MPFIVLPFLWVSHSYRVTRMWPAGVSCHHPERSHPGVTGDIFAPADESAVPRYDAMRATIRDYEPPDEEAVVGLSLRAWEPVFAAVEELLGSELFVRLRGEWRASQAKEVRDVLADPDQRVWVAEHRGQAIGFVAATLHRESGVGEVYMIAVDPSVQGQGIGTGLTEVVTEWLRRSGMRVAMIETGGDRGHAPARRIYEKVGYTALPAVRYFKSL